VHHRQPPGPRRRLQRIALHAMATKERAGKLKQRLQAMRLAFTHTRKVDAKLVPLMLGAGLGVLLVVGGLTGVVIHPAAGVLFGILFGVLAALMVFGRRVQKAQYTMMEGHPGAAAAVLQQLRGPWHVTPGVAFTRKQDLVHRVVGRPGIILVGEGSPARVGTLLKQERRRVARAAGDVPVHEVSVGAGDGQVALPKLQNHIMKLRKKLKRQEAADLETRLAALQDQSLPIPKGKLPYTKKQR
jgi:hypothetical protein